MVPLLSQDQSSDSIRDWPPTTKISPTPLEFRNKVAHGEITHLVTDVSDYDSSAEHMAADQESKMRLFVSEWFNTAPDVQEGNI